MMESTAELEACKTRMHLPEGVAACGYILDPQEVQHQKRRHGPLQGRQDHHCLDSGFSPALLRLASEAFLRFRKNVDRGTVPGLLGFKEAKRDAEILLAEC